MNRVSDEIQDYFTCPELVFSILSFSTVTELLATFQYLNKTSYKLIEKDGYLLRVCLMNALGMNPNQALSFEMPDEEEKKQDGAGHQERPQLLQHSQITSLLHLAKYCIKNAHRAPPMQLLGFRSTLGCDQPPLFRHKFQIYNLGLGDFNVGFCSQKPGPGCFTLIPYVYDNCKFESQIDNFQYISDFVYSWKDSIEAIKHLNNFMNKELPKLRTSKGMMKEVTLDRFLDCIYSTKSNLSPQKRSTWQYFEKWITAIHDYTKDLQSLFQRPKEVLKKEHPVLGSLAKQNYKSELVCYDMSAELEDMKDYLLAMFSFCISTSNDYTCNLRSFAVLLHNEPVVVEESSIYQIIKNWDKKESLLQSIEEKSDQIPEIKLVVENPHSIVTFFKQSYYQSHPQEKVRLLCWGEIQKSHGDFYFDLPTPQSTRFITVVGITCHRTLFMRYNQTRPLNIDIQKFTPFGFIVPSL